MKYGAAEEFDQFGNAVEFRDVDDDGHEGVGMFHARTRRPLIELVSPLGIDSPLSGWLSKQIAYNVCYEVDDLGAALLHVRQHRCVVISEPTPAVAFEGRHAAWFFTSTRQLTEPLQRAK